MSPTSIEWTEETWNPVTGCTKVSAGCDNCYAERITNRFGGPGAFDKIVLHPERLEKPLHWKKPRSVFVNSMSDLFHADVPLDFVARTFAVMALTPRHTYQVLTKRPGRMRALLKDGRWAPTLGAAVEDVLGDYPVTPKGARDWPLPNVWLGVSVEDQEHADKRLQPLAGTAAAVRFLSCEPLLGPVSIRQAWGLGWERFIGWVIAGGESGPGARPMHPSWARSLRDECVDAGVPFFFKQWGGLTPKSGGRVLDGRTWDETPG